MEIAGIDLNKAKQSGGRGGGFPSCTLHGNRK